MMNGESCQVLVTRILPWDTMMNDQSDPIWPSFGQKLDQWVVFIPISPFLVNRDTGSCLAWDIVALHKDSVAFIPTSVCIVVCRYRDYQVWDIITIMSIICNTMSLHAPYHIKVYQLYRYFGYTIHIVMFIFGDTKLQIMHFCLKIEYVTGMPYRSTMYKSIVQ